MILSGVVNRLSELPGRQLRNSRCKRESIESSELPGRQLRKRLSE